MKRQRSAQHEAWRKEYRKRMRLAMEDKVILCIALIMAVFVIALMMPR